MNTLVVLFGSKWWLRGVLNGNRGLWGRLMVESTGMKVMIVTDNGIFICNWVCGLSIVWTTP